MSCEYCGRIFGHSSRCPLFKEKHIVGKCKYCNDNIIEYEEYVENNICELFHTDCLMNEKFFELMNWLNIEIKCYDPDDYNSDDNKEDLLKEEGLI